MRAFTFTLLSAMASLALWAQDASQDIVINTGGAVPFHAVGFASQTANIQFLAAMPGPAEKQISGAPFTADGVTDFRQTLADGTVISRSSTSKIARDGEGRTRREFSPGPLPLSSGAAPPKLVTIVDPVAGKSIQLLDDAKTAIVVKLPPPPPPGDMNWTSQLPPPPGATFERRIEKGVAVGGAPEPMGAAIFTDRVFVGPGAGDVQEEDLGTQTIEGVQAQGKRTVSTIAAGQIGNDRPIRIVSERWYSPDLQLIVKSSVDDPQNGETQYRLTNLRRIEPDPSLFQVPPGYTVKEEAGPVIQFQKRVEKK